jgi:hypothetical protein
MRTKTVLLTTLLGAASIASSVAQTVYSVNAVGYVNVTVPASSFALLANPLNQPTNTLAAVLPDAPSGSKVYIVNATGAFDQFTKQTTGAWTGAGVAAARLNPGTGFFFKNGATTNYTLTFVGEVPQTSDTTPLTITYTAGFSLLGSIVPQEGGLETDLKYTPTVGDMVYRYNSTTSTYIQSTRQTTGKWTGSGITGETDPKISVAQGFWLKAKNGGTWTRTFTISQ